MGTAQARRISALILAALLLAPAWKPGVGRMHQIDPASETGSPTFGTTTRVSITSDGSQGNGDSFSPSISADGRFVAFSSDASNLVSEDLNNFCDVDSDYQYDDNCRDVFVHDQQTGNTERVSISSEGEEGNSYAHSPSISADGRYVAFESDSSNLVVGDTNNFCWSGANCHDIFVHDRQTGITERVSVASDGNQGNDMSWIPSISADGRYVAFASFATNLVSNDTNNFCLSGANCQDIFVHDRQTGYTERVSISSDGSQANGWSGSPTISADGRYVAFTSDASNLVDGDNNARRDVFIHDRQTGDTECVSVSSNSIQGNDRSGGPSISADGRFVAFSSEASNLVGGDTNYFCSYGYNCTDVFVHDRQTGITERVSIASDGSQANSQSVGSSISADGRYVVFSSEADNLVIGDTNNNGDVFLHDRQTGLTKRVSIAFDGRQGSGYSSGSSISVDGLIISFSSNANNLVFGDTNSVTDVFVHDRGEQKIDNSLYLPVTLNKP